MHQLTNTITAAMAKVAPLATVGGERIAEMRPVFVHDRAARRIAEELQGVVPAGFEVAGPAGRRAQLTIHASAWTTAGVEALNALLAELRAAGVDAH